METIKWTLSAPILDCKETMNAADVERSDAQGFPIEGSNNKQQEDDNEDNRKLEQSNNRNPK